MTKADKDFLILKRKLDEMNKRFDRFVKLTMNVQEELLDSIESSMMIVIPDQWPMGSMKEIARKEFAKSKKIVERWQKSVVKEVL